MESTEQAAAKIRAYLKERKYRKARDEAKLHLKSAPAVFTPLLIEANIGLAEEMASKAMLKEAEQVVEYLKKFITPEEITSLRAKLTGLADPKNRLPVLKQAHGKFLSSLLEAAPGSEDRLAAADRLVLDFAQPRSNNEAGDTIRTELGIVHRAMKLLSESLFAEMAECLRQLPTKSDFNHWRSFLKGCAAFYSADREKAVKFFEQLPKNTSPAQAAVPFLSLLGKLPAEEQMKPAVLKPTLQLCGVERAPRAASDFASYLEQGDRTGQLYSYLEWLNEFHLRDGSLLGEISALSLYCPSRGSDEFMEDVFVAYETTKTAASKAALARIYCISPPIPDDLDEVWSCYMVMRKALSPPNPATEAMAQAWAAKKLLVLAEGDPWDEDEIPRERYLASATKFLHEAIRLTPGSSEYEVQLADLYEKTGNNSARNKLIDDLAKRYPNDNPVLVRNAKLCLERGALEKARTSALTAVGNDPVDLEASEILREVQVHRAHKFATSRKSAAVRQIWQELWEHSATQSEQRWQFWAQLHGWLFMCGEDDDPDCAINGLASAPHPIVYWFHVIQTIVTAYKTNRAAFIPLVSKILNRAIELKPTSEETSVLCRWAEWLYDAALRFDKHIGLPLAEQRLGGIQKEFLAMWQQGRISDTMIYQQLKEEAVRTQAQKSAKVFTFWGPSVPEWLKAAPGSWPRFFYWFYRTELLCHSYAAELSDLQLYCECITAGNLEVVAELDRLRPQLAEDYRRSMEARAKDRVPAPRKGSPKKKKTKPSHAPFPKELFAQFEAIAATLDARAQNRIFCYGETYVPEITMARLRELGPKATIFPKFLEYLKYKMQG